MNYQKPLWLSGLATHFPRTSTIQTMRADQQSMLDFVSEHGNSIIEAPTGAGKTAVELAILKAAAEYSTTPVFWIVPNKTVLQQIAEEFPDDVSVIYGRNEHECLYYGEDDRPSAHDVPCSLLQKCAHRVDQKTGDTHEEKAVPCPYLQAKYEAKKGKIILCTMAFYLFSYVFGHEFEQPEVLVVDEAHRLADSIRSVLTYSITDVHLQRGVELLQSMSSSQTASLKKFRSAMVRIVKKNGEPRLPKLLSDADLINLLTKLELINTEKLYAETLEWVGETAVEARVNSESFKRLEVLIRDLKRYLRGMKFSLAPKNRPQLDYTYGEVLVEEGNKQSSGNSTYRLTVCGYHVKPLIAKMLGKTTVLLSATIGDNRVFEFITGLKLDCLRMKSRFSNRRTRLFMPTDTPNLAKSKSTTRDRNKVIRKIAAASVKLRDAGHRVLVVTISNVERDRTYDFCREAGLNVLSYGNGSTARESAGKFRDGGGDILVGTAANYAEGIDLPGKTAPVIFYFRPGYPNPHSPSSQFEERRFGRGRWAIWNWRVVAKALQARGRNIRGTGDRGVTIFISQQFRTNGLLYNGLPPWLQGAYKNDRTFDQSINDTIELLKT